MNSFEILFSTAFFSPGFVEGEGFEKKKFIPHQALELLATLMVSGKHFPVIVDQTFLNKAVVL